VAVFYPKFVRVNATADGDNTIIAGVPGKKVRVLGYAITIGGGAGIVTFQDTAASPNIFATFSLPANGGVSYSGNHRCPAFETAQGPASRSTTPPGGTRSGS
jgi:hypothetical protein